MKSEHRHELAENDLEKFLNRALGRIEPYSNQILIGFLVVTVVVAGTIVTLRSARASRALGWAQMAACRAADDFAEVADEFDGSVVGAWARLRAADGWLQQGIELSLSDRAASIDRLEQAEAAYNKLLESSVAPPEVREQALYGLALTLEANSDGDTGPAIKAYEQLLQEFPQTRFRTWAETRIEELGTGRVQQFYAWFHKAQPSPQDRPMPQDFSGLPSTTPGSTVPTLGSEGALPGNVLGGPALGGDAPLVTPTGENAGEMPAEDAADAPSETTPPAPPLPDTDDSPMPLPAPGGDAPAGKKEDQPADSKPAGSKPADSKSADSKPADDKSAESKPAEDKSAEDKPADDADAAADDAPAESTDTPSSDTAEDAPAESDAEAESKSE